MTASAKRVARALARRPVIPIAIKPNPFVPLPLLLTDDNRVLIATDQRFILTER